MSKDIQTMNNDLGPIPDVFKDRVVDMATFTAGLAPSFPVINVKGGRWGIRFGGETTPFTEADPRAGGAQTPVSHLDVVILKAATRNSKSFYEGEFEDKNNEPPTCWSADGIRPDDSVQQKQNPICASCPKNQRGSKIANGKMLKLCTDIARVAVARVEEINNPLGPILLRVTPGSQSNYRNYIQWLAGRHRPPDTVVTRMTFDAEASFPKIQFRAPQGLTNEQAVEVDKVLKHPLLNSVLNGKDMAAFFDPEQDEQDAAGGLPPTGGLPPANSQFGPPITPKGKTEPEPAEAKLPLTPLEQQIKDLEAQLAEAEKPEPEPEPEPEVEALTPEQLRIKELEAKLAEAQAGKKKRGRPSRSNPVGPPATPDSITQSGNGTDEGKDIGNDLTNRITALKAGRQA